jgi:hypothetical protein
MIYLNHVAGSFGPCEQEDQNGVVNNKNSFCVLETVNMIHRNINKTPFCKKIVNKISENKHRNAQSFLRLGECLPDLYCLYVNGKVFAKKSGLKNFSETIADPLNVGSLNRGSTVIAIL